MYPFRNISFRILLGAVFVPSFFFLFLGVARGQVPNSGLGMGQAALDQIVNDPSMRPPTAQEINEAALHNYLNFEVTPENPKPNEQVRVTIKSFLTDLNKATIRWALNGKTALVGTGETTFNFKNGASGSTTNLTISITTNGGAHVEKKLSWSPLGVTVLWEAATYTPPFYRGKALASPQARMRAVAIPDSTNGQNALGPGSLSYVWEKDGDVVGSASGYRKNSFLFSAPMPYGQSNVRVTVSSLNDAFSSSADLDLALTNPFILFYENTPLLGVWYNRPLAPNYTLSKKEFSVSAEPFYFSNDNSGAQYLEYNWTVNGNPTQNASRLITLRNDEGAQGDSVVSLVLNELQKTFQTATQTLTIHMDNSGGSSARQNF